MVDITSTSCTLSLPIVWRIPVCVSSSSHNFCSAAFINFHFNFIFNNYRIIINIFPKSALLSVSWTIKSGKLSSDILSSKMFTPAINIFLFYLLPLLYVPLAVHDVETACSTSLPIRISFFLIFHFHWSYLVPIKIKDSLYHYFWYSLALQE